MDRLWSSSLVYFSSFKHEMVAIHATPSGFHFTLILWGLKSASIDDSIHTTLYVNRTGFFFKCANMLYLVWDAFGVGWFYASLVGGRLDLRTGMGFCDNVCLDRSCTWWTTLYPGSSFSATPLSWMILTRATSSFSWSSVTTPRSTSFWSSGWGPRIDLLFFMSWVVIFFKNSGLCWWVGWSCKNCFFIKGMWNHHPMECAAPVVFDFFQREEKLL